jgi:ArsR family transcriptional regulator
MSNYRNEEIARLSGIFKALANPNRLQLFVKLTEVCVPGQDCCQEGDESRCVGDLGKDLDLAPSTVSHHIKELRQAGLIKVERNGKKVNCHIDYQSLHKLLKFFQPAKIY